MTGVDYELLAEWEPEEGTDTYIRRKPVRLRDREALLALLRRFERYAGTNNFMFSANEEDFDSTVDFSELVDRLPSRVSVLHLQTYSEPFMVVRLTSWEGGQTWVDAPEGDVFDSPRRSLIGVIEGNSRPIGFRRRLTKSRWRWLARRARVSVVERDRRDVLSERRFDRRTAMIGAVFGLIGGLAAVLFAAVIGD
ncbi:hypothetical protein [Demequina mangrovi]|uniref:Uncharacterized protein n=1 Tax=Demequina mangrovi TaxID=1043493 RepID=A0A1H6YXM2_9MICO|nr:hypothetical protein [Demequina mangrovi]SEJ46013.1 hypothetical protein SAMN05421637_1855 [Demequina mangrovi]